MTETYGREGCLQINVTSGASADNLLTACPPRHQFVESIDSIDFSQSIARESESVCASSPPPPTVSFLNGAWGYPLNFGGQKPFFWKTYQYWCDSIGNLLTRRDQVVFSKKNLFSGSEVSSKSKVRSKLPLKNNVFWRNKKIKKNWLQKKYLG